MVSSLDELLGGDIRAALLSSTALLPRQEVNADIAVHPVSACPRRGDEPSGPLQPHDYVKSRPKLIDDQRPNRVAK
jgi:hypothetical protein